MTRVTEAKLTARQACKVGLVQVVTPSIADAQELAHEMARHYASSAEEGRHFCATTQVSLELQALAGDLPPSDRRVLAISAFAQAQSTQVRILPTATLGLAAQSVIFTSSVRLQTRDTLRGSIQEVLSAVRDVASDGGLTVRQAWEDVRYVSEYGDTGASGTGSVAQLLQQLTRAQQSAHGGINDGNATAGHDVALVQLSPLAAGFTDVLTRHPDASPWNALIEEWMALRDGTEGADAPSEKVLLQEIEQPVATGAQPHLRLLRRAGAMTAPCQAPMVIAHSLLGDHKGYGRLWTAALEQNDVC